MWNAIKGDLLEFVNVIQSDVVHTMETNTDNTPNSNSTSKENLNELGNTNADDIEKLGSSRETFTEDVHHHDYGEFKSKFHLDDYAFDITRLLSGSNNVFGDVDNLQSSKPSEIGVFFEELVPFEMSKEEFWARYYFRVYKINSDSSYMKKMVNASVEEDEEEEEENIPWDDEDTEPQTQNNVDDVDDSPPSQTLVENDSNDSNNGATNGEGVNNSMLGMTMLNINAYDYNTLLNENSNLRSSSSKLKEMVRSLESELITTKVEYELIIKQLEDKLAKATATPLVPTMVSTSVSHNTCVTSAATTSIEPEPSSESDVHVRSNTDSPAYDGAEYMDPEDADATPSIASTNQSTSSMVYIPSDTETPQVLSNPNLNHYPIPSDDEDEDTWE